MNRPSKIPTARRAFESSSHLIDGETEDQNAGSANNRTRAPKLVPLFLHCLHLYPILNGLFLDSLLPIPPHPPFSPSYPPPTRAARVMSVKLDSGPITSLFKTPQHPDSPTFYHAYSPSMTVPHSPAHPHHVPITPTHSALPTLLPSSPSSPQRSFLPQDLCTCSSFCQKCFFLLCIAYLSTLSLSHTSPKSSFLVIQCKEPP